MKSFNTFTSAFGLIAIATTSSLLAQQSIAASPDVKMSALETSGAWAHLERNVEEVIVVPTVDLTLLDEAMAKSFRDAVADLERRRP